jgi:hypothetical protein
MGLCSVWKARINTPSHTTWRSIWRANSGLSKICGAHGLVVGRRMMLGEIVTKVLSAGFPINKKMVLANGVVYPIESHVHCT